MDIQRQQHELLLQSQMMSNQMGQQQPMNPQQ